MKFSKLWMAGSARPARRRCCAGECCTRLLRPQDVLRGSREGARTGRFGKNRWSGQRSDWIRGRKARRDRACDFDRARAQSEC